MYKINSTLKVNLPNSNYEILIGEGIFDNLQELISTRLKYNRCAIVTNETIYKIYSNKINLNCDLVILKDGEEYKNFDSYKYILDRLLNIKLERGDLLIALGGGVVGDITGFAAATYLRGIRFIQVPTTLLAQVDSSVGGKVAINHETGKNLIGAFWQPSLVVADTSFLKTLDIRQLNTGLGEVLKYALIELSCHNPNQNNYKKSFFDFLMENKDNIYALKPSTLAELVHRCCELKASVVNLDEKESGLRMILNYGHTFAHAIEKCTNYTKFTHGEAVATGIKMALDLSLHLGMIEKNYYEEAQKLIRFFNIEISLKNSGLNHIELANAILHDKKVKDNKPRFVLSSGKAQCSVVCLDDRELVEEIFKKYVD